MITETAVEWYRHTCTRCGTWWIAHYDVRRFTDEAGVSRAFYQRGGLACEPPARERTLCPSCGHASVRAELLDHPATDTAPQPPASAIPGPAAHQDDLDQHPRAGERGRGGPGHAKFQAVVSLEEPGPRQAARPYPSGTHALMVRAASLHDPGEKKFFPAATFTVDGRPLRPGDREVIVTIWVTGKEAAAFLGPGHSFVLWDGGDVGHGIVSRRVFTWPEFG